MTGVDVDPCEVAAAMISKALPGFESRVVPARDSVGIRGALPIGGEVSAETIFYHVYSHRPAFIDVVERDRLVRDETPAEREARHAEQRAALERELAPVVEPIVERIQRLAIDAVGLEPVIAERERRARLLGEREGRELGHRQGVAEGRAAGIRDVLRALLTHSAEIGEAVDEIRESWGVNLDE